MSRAHTDTASLVLHSAKSKRLGNIIQMGLGHRDPPAFAVFAGTLHPWTLMDSLIKRMEEPNTPALISRRGTHLLGSIPLSIHLGQVSIQFT